MVGSIISRMAGTETVLVIGGGGRESALVHKYSQSEHVEKILAIPGNDMMDLYTDKYVGLSREYGEKTLKTTDIPEILEICKEEGVGLVDVAQDNAIEVGLVDELRKKGIPVVGPTKAAGQIEWDKIWARHFGLRIGLPQSVFMDFMDPVQAVKYVRRQEDQPYFIKAAFLAEGKGALPARNRAEAVERILQMSKLKNQAGREFVIEKWLSGDDGSPGEEFSVFALCDGKNYQILGSAQDYKRALNFDEGENTGGMGCSSPPLILDEKYSPGLMEKIQTRILDKVVQGLHDEGRPYTGVLYLGGMAVWKNGELDPYVIEFNARWGDPEAQVILPGIKNDWFEVGMAVAYGDISKIKIERDGLTRVAVVGVSHGYPGDYSAVKGKRIYGLGRTMAIDGVTLYGAGVRMGEDDDYADGGRLFHIVGEGINIVHARERAYQAMARVFVEGNLLHYRTDIGNRDVTRFYQPKTMT